MNYKAKPADIDGIIEDIEYLRKKGRNPWTGASGRRAMEERFSYSKTLTAKGHNVAVFLSTSASCNYTRFSVFVSIDGEEKKKYIPALRALA